MLKEDTCRVIGLLIEIFRHGFKVVFFSHVGPEGQDVTHVRISGVIMWILGVVWTKQDRLVELSCPFACDVGGIENLVAEGLVLSFLPFEELRNLGPHFVPF